MNYSRSQYAKSVLQKSVSEDFLECDGLDRAEGTETSGIKVLDVAKDSVMVCAAFNHLLLNLLHILKSEGLEYLIHSLRTMLGKAKFACVQIAVEPEYSATFLISYKNLHVTFLT